MPRLTKLTPDVADTILKALTLGAFVKDACDAAGIYEPRFYDWIKRGMAALDLMDRIADGETNADGSALSPPSTAEELFAEFAYQAKRAEADSRISALATVRKGERGWQGSAWFLERRDHKNWGRRTLLEHSGPDGAPIRMQPVPQMSDDDLARIAAGTAIVTGDTVVDDDVQSSADGL